MPELRKPNSAIALGMVCLFAWCGEAFSRGNYAETPPALKKWFQELKNQNGESCCDIYDGYRIEDPDWECKTPTDCAVKVDGDWIIVPRSTIIQPKPGDPSLAYAIVWRQGRKILCFRPGPGF